MNIRYYTDNTGLQHESYEAACIYYGADTPASLEGEAEFHSNLFNEEMQAFCDDIEARGPTFQAFPSYPDEVQW
jgi:hypothetical protein